MPSPSYNAYAAKMDAKLEYECDYGWDEMSHAEFKEQVRKDTVEKELKRKAEIAAMEAALKQNRASKRAIPSVNPCSEIYLGNDPIQVHNNISAISAADIRNMMDASASHIAGGTIPADKISTGKIIMSVYNTAMQDTKLAANFSQGLTVDFDEAVWSISVPGIAKEALDVFTVKDRVYVEVKATDTTSKRRFEFVLAEGETVKSTKLDLGILTVVIDRPAKRESIKIA